MTATVRLGFLAAVLAGLSQLPLAGQVRPPQPEPPPAESRFQLAVDGKPAIVLEAIRDHLADADWDRLVPALQSVIDRGEVFLSTTPGEPMTTARAAGLKVLRSLPEPGREYYRKRYDPVAKALLDQATKTADPQPLLDLLARYPETTPAAAAQEQLGRLLARRDRDAESAAAFGQFAARQPVEKWSAETLYLAGGSLARVGSADPLAGQVKKRLLEVAGGGVIVGERKLTRDDVAKDLAGPRVAPPAGVPLPLPLWKKPATTSEELRARIDEAASGLRRQGRLIPPGPAPALVRLPLEGKERDAVLVRTFDGLQAFDRASGELLWQATPGLGLADLLRDPATAQAARLWLSGYGTPSTVLFDNSRLGRFATDATRAFLVEDVPYLANPAPFAPAVPVPAALADAVENNRLLCVGLGSGKVLWEAGGKADPSLAGWFLGTPLVLGDTLLTLHEQNRELRLVRLDAKTGKVLRVHPLGALAGSLNHGNDRRRAFQLVVAGDRLLVPTASGALLALALPGLDVAWLYQYGEAAAEPPRLPFPRVPTTFPQPGYAYEPLAEGDLVVYAGPDSRKIHALDPATGAPRWTAAAEETDRVVGPLLPGGLVVLGEKGVRLLDRKTGQVRWSTPPLSPLGSGLAFGNRFLLPVAGPVDGAEFVVLDLETGKPTAGTRIPAGVPLGGVHAVGADVAMSGPGGVALLPQLASVRTRLEKDVEKAGAEGLAARLELAEVDHQLGNLDRAVTNARKVLDAKPDAPLLPRARDLLFRLLAEAVRTDPARFGKHRDELTSLADVAIPADAPAAVQDQMKQLRRERQRVLLPLLAEGFLRERQPGPAVEAALRLVAEEPADALLDGSAVGQRVSARAFAAGVVLAALETNDPAVLKRLTDGDPMTISPALPLGTAADGVHLRRARSLAEKDAAAADRLLARLARDGRAEHAAQALDDRHRIALKENRFADVAALARDLAGRFPEAKVAAAGEEPRTGKQVLEALAADKRVAPFLAEPKTVGKWKVAEEPAGPLPSTYPLTLLPFESGLPSETFALEMDGAGRNLAFTAPRADKPAATLALPASRVVQEHFSLLSYMDRIRTTQAGRALLVPLGEHLLAIDSGTRKLLWGKNTLGPRAAEVGTVGVAWLNMEAGWYSATYPEGLTLVKGVPVACVGAVVVAATPDGLEGLDVETGRTLWQRRDLAGAYLLVAVGQKFLAVEYRGFTPGASRWLHAADGSPAAGPDRAGTLARARMLHGGRALTVTDGTKLAVIDLAAEEPAWQKELPAGSVVLRSRVLGVFGWVEPTGDVRLLDLATRRELATTKLDAANRDVEGGTILADGANLYVATANKKRAGDALNTQSLFSTVVPVQQARATGLLLAFHQGKLAWQVESPGMYVALAPDGDAPLVVLSISRVRQVGGQPQSEQTLVVLDRRTGKRLYDKTTTERAPRQLLGLTWRPEPAQVELVGTAGRLKFTPDE